MFVAFLADSRVPARAGPLLRAASQEQIATYATWGAGNGREQQYRTQGDLPKVPTLPQRSVLLKKLLQYERLALQQQHPQQQQLLQAEQHAAPLPAAVAERQQARACRRAAAQQYIADVKAAAAKQDIQLLLQQLAVAPPPPTEAAAAVDLKHAASSSRGRRAPGSVLADAAAAAVRHLAAASRRPEHAQAFVELAVERQLLQPHQVQRAVHAVLQAYADKGDHRGVLAAASRFYATSDPQDSSSSSSSALLPSDVKPSSCTLALLLRSAAATRDSDLLIGAWKLFGGFGQQQQQQQHRYGSSSSSSSVADALAPPVVLHALLYGSVMCDLAAAAAARRAGSSSGMHGFAAAPLAATIFQEDSTTIEILREINYRLEQYQQHQQLLQQRQQQRDSGQQQQQKVQLPFNLLHPCEATELLQYSSSTADVDALLLSQLYQPGGLAVDDIMQLTQRYVPRHQQPGTSATSADVATPSNPLLLLTQLSVSAVPQFPPQLRADVARAAVAAYMRHGAVTRAAAIAHAAAISNPRDIQQYHILIRGCAAMGQLMPALVMLDKLRSHLWQSTTPKAQAAMLRALARCGSSPPLGAAPSASRLLSFFRRYCSPHPLTWAALVQGLVITGDKGPRVWKALRSAMSQPYSYMAMAGYTSEVLDKARSRIVAHMIRGILASNVEGSRLPAVIAAADDAAGTAPAVQIESSSSSSSSVGWNAAAAGSTKTEDRLRRSLAVPEATAAAVYAPEPALLASQQQQWQQPLPGLPLHEQPVHLRNQVLLLLTVFDVLASWGVVLHHDAALAAALQVLRYCLDTEDARQSGLLIAVLRSALSLGIQPTQATLRALLACCKTLESRAGKTPMGLATGLGFRLEDLGYVDLHQVLAACQEAVQYSEQYGSTTDANVSKPADSPAAAALADVLQSGSSSSSSAAEQLAADLLRTWAFNSTFDYVNGVMAHGPAWALHNSSINPTSSRAVQATVGM